MNINYPPMRTNSLQNQPCPTGTEKGPEDSPRTKPFIELLVLAVSGRLFGTFGAILTTGFVTCCTVVETIWGKRWNFWTCYALLGDETGQVFTVGITALNKRLINYLSLYIYIPPICLRSKEIRYSQNTTMNK